MSRMLTLLRSTRPRRLSRSDGIAPGARPALTPALPVFALRVGPAGARSFGVSLSRVDRALREVLADTARFVPSARPVVTVVLPEAVHLVVCARRETVEILGAGLLRALRGIAETGENDPERSSAPKEAVDLRLSILRVGGLVSAAGTVLDLPRARGLVASDESWPWARAGEA